MTRDALERQLSQGLELDPAEVSNAVDRLVQAASRGELIDVAWTVEDTPVGPLVIAGTIAGVVKISFGDEEETLVDLAKRVSPRVLRDPARLDRVRRQLEEYFVGRREVFDVPLDWQLSRGFRQTVLRALDREVPFGHTVTYKELSERAGSPKAVRATGSAMATNPIPIVVPCHRVIGSNGSLTGYGGGLDNKRWLLRHEGALLA